MRNGKREALTFNLGVIYLNFDWKRTRGHGRVGEGGSARIGARRGRELEFLLRGFKSRGGFI